MLSVTKSGSHICCMPISDHSGNHDMDKCSQHVCFSVWTVSCYLHVYNTEWYNLYWTLHRELCPWQLITCIRCWVRHIYREVFSIDKVHHAHFMLQHSSSPVSGVESKRWIHVLSLHRDENDSSDNFWWVLKIPLNMWSPLIKSSYMKAFQSVTCYCGFW